MVTYSVCRRFGWEGEVSAKAAAVMRMFGLTTEKLREGALCHSCEAEVEAGDIVYITGPSGAGKSVLLREFEQRVPAGERVNLQEIAIPVDRRVVDCFEGDVVTTLRQLSAAGLNDVRCLLSEPAKLSEGQKWRFRLAAAMATGRKFVFADDFCCELDRVTAAVVSYNVRKFASRRGVTFFLASCHDDVASDLAPDVLIVKESLGPAEVIYKQRRKPWSDAASCGNCK
jgi:ABC-type ATPase with predicted acetyltransferase domain